MLETCDFVFDDDFERAGWRAALGWYVVPHKLEVRARHAEITRLKDPTYQKTVDSGLGNPEVWDGEDWAPALEATISETSAAVSYTLPGWRNKVALDISRLERQFAADPDAVIDGISTPIAKAPRLGPASRRMRARSARNRSSGIARGTRNDHTTS